MTLIKKIFAVVLSTGLSAVVSAQPIDSRIRLNTVGFIPDFPKTATVAAPVTEFTVNDAVTGAILYTGTPDTIVSNADTREDQLSILNFAGFQRVGTYYLNVPGVGRSPNFRIAVSTFRETYRTMMLGMYLWRCGNPGGVRAALDGITYSHAACHLSDGDMLHTGVTGWRDGSGGWHDAGDYNKYVVNSGVTVGLMLKAWEHFHHILDTVTLHVVTRDGAIPAYLAEVKWNLDWVAKMQFDDGRVSHKISTERFGGNIMPNDENAVRYFVPWSTEATASFVAMMALGARIYAPYAPETAARWLQQARLSYDILQNEPSFVRADQDAFSTGRYDSGDHGGSDSDNRLWAAAEMWETTGETQYLADVENRLRSSHVRAVTEWADVSSLGAFTYLSSSRPGRREELLETIRSQTIATANNIIKTVSEHGYGRTYGNVYYWGTNGAVASTAYTLNTAYRLTGDMKYRYAVQDALNYLLGRNYFGRSMVTRVGHNPPQNPHCRRSVASRQIWPGYLIGGPHNGKPAEMQCPNMPGTCWDDVSDDYYTNEIAINWNSAMIYALAGMLPGAGVHPAPCYPGQPECSGFISIRHTARSSRTAPAAGMRAIRVVSTQSGRIDIPPGARVYSINGKLVAQRRAGDPNMPLIRRNGVYIIKIDEKRLK